MKTTALCMLTAAITLALLPPGAGFVAAWMLLQSAAALPRIGGPIGPMGIALAVVAMAFGAAMGAVALLRIAGLAVLGRPRTPRSAAAEESTAPRRVMSVLAALLALAGIVPATGLALAAPALRLLTGAPETASLLGLVGDSDPLWALPIATALAAFTFLLARLARPGPDGGRVVGMWEDGFAAPPPWLPFGDPTTQLGAAPLAAPWRRPLPFAIRLPAIRLPRPLARATPTAALLALAGLLTLAMALR